MLWGNVRELWLDISDDKEFITKQRQYSTGVRESGLCYLLQCELRIVGTKIVPSFIDEMNQST